MKHKNNPLTEKELKVLFLYAAGYSREHIANTLNVSKNTLPDYFYRLKNKLNAKTISELRSIVILRILENQLSIEI